MLTTKSTYRAALIFVIFLGFSGNVLAQQISPDSARRWVNKGEWRKGLTSKVHSSVNKVAFATQYQKNKVAWDIAFSFLRDSNLVALKPGKYLLYSDYVYATITEGPAKDMEKTSWESHIKYIDLHYVILGAEKIGRAPLETASETKPYDDEKDVANYDAAGSFYTAKPGTFFLFFPDDVHRAGIKLAGFDVVRKLVIKIRVAD